MSLSSNPFNTRYPSNTVDIAAHHSLHLSGRWSSSNVQVQWRLDLLPGIQVSWMEDMMRGAMSQSLQSGLALPVGIVGGHWCIPYSLFHFLDAGITRSASTSIAWFELEDGEMSLTLWTVYLALPTSETPARLQRTTSRKKQKNRAIFQKENANFCRIRLHHEKNQKGAILIPKEECKLLPQNPKKHFFGIFLEFIKIGIPKKLSTLRQNFFANFFCIFFWNSSRFS